MSDLVCAVMFVALLCVASLLANKFQISRFSKCEIINEMVKYCYNDKGERERV